MNRIIRVGIAGFGIASKIFHAPFLKVSPHYEVIAVLERHHEESKALFPNVQVVRSFEELLQTNIDLVVIATPNETHYPYAKQCLLEGKAVVVDKPFTITSEEALQIRCNSKTRRYFINSISQSQVCCRLYDDSANTRQANAWRCTYV